MLLQALETQGVDGLQYKNAMGREGPGLSYIATKPGTVRSATTGEKLFSDTGNPSPLGAALAGSQDDDTSSHAAIMDLLKKYGGTP